MPLTVWENWTRNSFPLEKKNVEPRTIITLNFYNRQTKSEANIRYALGSKLLCDNSFYFFFHSVLFAVICRATNSREHHTRKSLGLKCISPISVLYSTKLRWTFNYATWSLAPELECDRCILDRFLRHYSISIFT